MIEILKGFVTTASAARAVLLAVAVYLATPGGTDMLGAWTPIVAVILAALGGGMTAGQTQPQVAVQIEETVKPTSMQPPS